MGIMITIKDRDDYDGYDISIDGDTTFSVTWHQARRLKQALDKRLSNTRDRVKAARDRWGKVIRNKFEYKGDSGPIIAIHQDFDNELELIWWVGKSKMQYTPADFVAGLKEQDRERAKKWISDNMP